MTGDGLAVMSSSGRSRRRRSVRTGLRSERGLLATELAMLMPVILVVALVAVFVVQVHRHGSQTQAAADTAARAASWAESPAQAESLAANAAARVCADSTTTVASWNPPDEGALRPGRVVVQLTCRMSFEAFAVLGASATRTRTATGVSTIEYWREA